jgi:hypothetical protein
VDIFTHARTAEERMSPLRQFFPAVPDGLRGNAVWEISLNAQGFRDEMSESYKLLRSVRVYLERTAAASVPRGS